MQQFRANLIEATKINRLENTTWKASPNEFYGMSFEEWQKMFVERNRDNALYRFLETFEFDEQDPYKTPPENVDWTSEIDMIPPINQGKCACSYAAAAAKVVELHHQIKSGERIPFSVQDIINCGGDYQKNM